MEYFSGETHVLLVKLYTYEALIFFHVLFLVQKQAQVQYAT